MCNRALGNPKGDGGHYPFSLASALLYLWATDNTSALNTLAADHPGSQLSMPFLITADMVTNDFVPHGDPDNLGDFTPHPYQWHRRRVSAVSGNIITIPTRRGGTGGTQGDDQKFRFQDLIMTDGTLEATVIGPTSDLPNDGTITVPIDSNPGFTTSSAIWFEPPTPLVPGAADWMTVPFSPTSKNRFSASPAMAYRNQQPYAGALMLAAALGQMRRGQDAWLALEAYCEQCRSRTYPNPTTPYPDVTSGRGSAGGSDKAMWDANWTTIKAVTQAS